MAFAGVGLHVIIALFFAVHAVRTGQNNYWLFILLAFPFLGSVVYAIAIYLPNSRLERSARQMARQAVKSLDPTRDLRDAQAAFDYSATAQNEIRLAQALLEADQPQQALQHFEASMKGPFANDLEIRWSAARAAFDAGKAQAALQHLKVIAQTDINYRADEVGLLIARAYAAQSDSAMARQSFEFLQERSGSFEVLAEYAIWCAESGDWGTAQRLKNELDKAQTHWSSHQRGLNRELLQRIQTAFAQKSH